MELQTTIPKDKEAADKGTVIPLEWDDAGRVSSSVTLRYFRNRRAELRRRELLSRYRQKFAAGGAQRYDAEVEADCHVLAECVVVAWEGIKEAGQDVTFSTTECFRLCRLYPQFRERLTEEAARLSNFAGVADDEEALGNS